MTGGDPQDEEAPANGQFVPTTPEATTFTGQERARALWVSFPRAWLEASMSPRRRLDGIAVVPPREKRKPFLYCANPYPHFFIPGRRGRRQFAPRRQGELEEAYAAVQRLWAGSRAAGIGNGENARAADLFSVPAVIVYSPLLRNTSKVVLMNLYTLRSPAPDGGYGDAGWIARGLLVSRVLPVYWRRHAGGTAYPCRDPRKIDRALGTLRDLGVIAFEAAVRDGHDVVDFKFLPGWEDRLGPMPLMPAASKVRPWGRVAVLGQPDTSSGALAKPAERTADPVERTADPAERTTDPDERATHPARC